METNIKELPSSIGNHTRLKILNLKDCNLCDQYIPADTFRLSSLEEIDLGGNSFIGMSSCLTQSYKLEFLRLSDCLALKSLSELLTRIKYVRIDCASLGAYPSKVCISECSAHIFRVNFFRRDGPIDAQTYMKTRLKNGLVKKEVTLGLRKIFLWKFGMIVKGWELLLVCAALLSVMMLRGMNDSCVELLPVMEIVDKTSTGVAGLPRV
ncbi:hypothetical protein CXB51_029209 [Gossypium anomalum]|uniref:Uncharacterized protein n=1 Tax=Gossypium anomalum TaxID=47600 RepID=A0A8J5Y7W4_9ROSI|nr:hypothetical protein CXB51_029209 [Gossypium anomalum]